MARISAVVDRPDEIQPFSVKQLDALLITAKNGKHPLRDVSIIYLMLDCALRASEVCGLKYSDLNMESGARVIQVEGKGGKKRYIPFQATTARSLSAYIKSSGGREVFSALFKSDRGASLTRSGLLQLFDRLGEAAGISTVRCSPHTMRHTSALMFLRAGGNPFVLQALLGHTDMKMTRRYTAIAQADVENQHRQFSPVETLRQRGKSM